MSSNIPRAREILEAAITDIDSAFENLHAALRLMTREKPEFRAKPELKSLSKAQIRRAKRLRHSGHSIHDIALRLGTQMGRVSEAINGKRNAP